jgi:hypothetical protein
MISCFDHFFRPASLPVTQPSFLFFRRLKLASRLEDGRVESYWLSVSNFLARIPILLATYLPVLLFIKCGRAGFPLPGERQIDIIGELI